MAGFFDQWWYPRKKELLGVAGTECPVVVYNEESLNDTLFDLLALDSLDALIYPVHVNPHPKILRKVFEMGGGFQCRSSNELDFLLALFPGINPTTILFMPETAGDQDFTSAFSKCVRVLVHNGDAPECHPEIFRHREIFVDLDITGEGTCNVQAMLQTLSSLEITVAGFRVAKNLPLFTDTNAWLPGLMEALGRFSKSTTLILGGERGVILNQESDTIDIPATGQRLEVIKEAYPGLALCLEPGSQVISGAGVLLAQVVQSSKENGIYVARINTEIDPPMEDRILKTAPHIVNLSRIERDTSPLIRFSGQEIRGPAPMRKGDILLFTNMGTFRSERIFSGERQEVSEHYLNARKLCPVKI